MLLPLILTFVNVYFLDLLLFNALLQAVDFLLCYYYAQTVWWHFLVQMPPGIAAALACRLVQHRILLDTRTADAPRKARKLKPLKHAESGAALLSPTPVDAYEEDALPPSRWWPRLLPRAGDDTWLWSALCAVAASAPMLVYNVVVHGGGADSLQTPFTVGVLIATLLVWLVLLVLEGVAYETQMGQADFLLWGLYPACGLVVAAMAALDMLAFLEGYYLVLIIGGLVLVMAAAARVFRWLMTPAEWHTRAP
jgi:hypothetical protein